MKIRVLAVFAFLIIASAAVAGNRPADTRRPGAAAGGRGNGSPVLLLVQADQPSPVPEAPPVAEGAVASPPPAAEPAPLSPAPEVSPAAEAAQAPPAGEEPTGPGEPPVAAPEGAAGEPIKEEGVTGEKAGVPPAPGRPVSPVPGVPAPPARRPVPGVPSVPGAPAYPTPGAGFLVKFNNADIYEVIHTLGRMAGINYLIDPRVRGVVNVHTQGTVRKEGALDLLLSILRINGATAVREGDLYHIVPMAEAKMEPLLLAAQGKAVGKESPNRPVMRAFPLQYISAAEMAKVLKPFLSGGGDVTEVPRANMVLVTDTAGNMEKHERLVELFDADAFRSAGVKLFPLKFLDPEEMGKNLETIFGALDFATKGGKPSGINFVPLPRMNSLLVVSASPRTLEDVERWIGELDREPTGTSRAVHLYRVRHGKARDVMEILDRLYPGKTVTPVGKTTEFKPKVAEPAGKQPLAAPAPAPRAEPKPAVQQEGTTFDIILDEPLNALIIRGSASEYAAILDTLRTIDVYPRQVLLEVLIAEVQLDDTLRLGIDWTYVKQAGEFGHDVSLVTSAAGITSGLKYVVEKTNRLTAAFRSLANDGKVSVLSSPSVISTNGKKAKIDVSDQVPIVTGKVTNPGLEQFITETVEYRDVGILLSFTPYINDEGIVTLEISQEVSEVKTTSVGASANPSFFKRSVDTTLIATQDRSIVLGGLVKERRERTRDGIPFLYKIPVFGWIFGARSNVVSRTELLIFITPRVIASIDEGTRLSREFEDRVAELKMRIWEAKGIKPLKKDDSEEK